MITKDRIKQLIKEHDENPNPRLGGLNYYLTYMRILFENEGIKNFQEWDYGYTQEKRCKIFRETRELINENCSGD